VEGRGNATYVAPGADVADAVGGTLAKLSRPALTDLRIVRAPVELLDQAPAVLPDLFYGEELVVLARYRGTGNGPVEIEGTRNGRRERFTVAGVFPRHEPANSYVPQLWAARRIGELSRQARLEGASPELIATIRDLGLRYGILTEHTAYLVQEPGMLARGEVQPEPAALVPREMTGERAFNDAKASAGMSASTTLAAADEIVRQRAQDFRRADSAAASRDTDRGDRSGPAEMRRAGGRLFTWRGGAWTDLGHHDSLRVVTVAPFSEAYFALVAARPAIREALAVGTPVVLAGRRASIKVDEGGTTRWAPGAMARFLRDFEGR
jgi:Ca-activated chloride channel family protein